MPATKTSSRKSNTPLKVAKKVANTAVAQKLTAKKAIKPKAEDGVPLSTIIRRRIQAKKARFSC